MDKTCSAAPLWTRDFTILTLGSKVEVLHIMDIGSRSDIYKRR